MGVSPVAVPSTALREGGPGGTKLINPKLGHISPKSKYFWISLSATNPISEFSDNLNFNGKKTFFT